MQNLAKALVALAALAFVLAVVTVFTGPIAGLAGLQPEGFSRASANLALLAIAYLLAFPNGRPRTL